jgi:hypothetical protein
MVGMSVEHSFLTVHFPTLRGQRSWSSLPMSPSQSDRFQTLSAGPLFCGVGTKSSPKSGLTATNGTTGDLRAGYEGMKQRETTIPEQGKLRLHEAV